MPSQGDFAIKFIYRKWNGRSVASLKSFIRASFETNSENSFRIPSKSSLADLTLNSMENVRFLRMAGETNFNACTESHVLIENAYSGRSTILTRSPPALMLGRIAKIVNEKKYLV
jgi:hypothetical protein